MAKRIIRLTESQLRQIVGKVINEQEAAGATPPAQTPQTPQGGAGEVSLNALAEVGTNIDNWLNGDVTTEDLNNISNELKTKVFGKTAEGGGCAMSKVIGYYAKSAGMPSWSKYFTLQNPISQIQDMLRSDLIKDIDDTGEIFEPQFNDVKKLLIKSINDELNGFCSKQTAAGSSDPTKQNAINALFCSVREGVVRGLEDKEAFSFLDNGLKTAEMGNFKDSLYQKSLYRPWDAVLKENNFTQAELEAAKSSCPDSELGKSFKSTTPKQQAINAVFCSVKDGKINTPGQLGDGSPWSGYTALYKITPEELAAAKASCPDSELGKSTAGASTPRQKFFNDAFCSVKDGKIVAPGTPSDGLAWDGFVGYYKPTPEELAAAKASCPDSELGKSAAPAVKPKAQWTKSNEQFPLKYGQFGAKIGEIQKDMGMSGDTYFGNTTEKGILAKAPEYKRETGVTEDIFNKIKAASPATAKAAPAPAAPAPAPTGDTTAAAPAPPTEAELQASPNTLNPY